MDTILLVDDDEKVLISQKDLLNLHGFRRIMVSQTAAEARRILDDNDIALAIIDLTLHEESGIELLRWIRGNSTDTVVLVVTGASDVSIAVECMRSGAYDFLIKGSDTGRLPSTVSNAIAHRRATMENAHLRNALSRAEPDHPEVFHEFISTNPVIRRIFVYIEAVARTPDPILITGETGVGKELIARAVHRASGLRGDFVAVNLGGLDDETVSDTLFGHVKGAFTSASGARDGLIRKAAGGTLFLDEFAEISAETQVKLLRLIDAGEFMPLGSDAVHQSQARLVFATNRDLQHEVEQGVFRKDLFFRITSHWVTIPPLRERPEDVRPLLEHLMKRHATRLYTEPIAVPEDMVEMLGTQTFAGNVRELEQIVVNALIHGSWNTEGFRSSISSGDTRIGDADINEHQIAFGATLPTPAQAVEAVLREADRRFPNNRSRAAAEIGLTPQAFANRWKRMDHPDPGSR
ncbi:MAG: sigma-54-dependent Fis family transcriptional regulator [Spirochaetaceae bacterium]|nr:MAG: sigma-54-dependent Fis family transcriptional regulator [Spirochaetaceae bacterium]